MSSIRVHLIRHGEVENPDGILYGRLEGFRLSERGRKMAELAAEYLHESGVDISRIIASPLQRTRESAEPIASRYGLPIEHDERLIEPWNHFEGQRMDFKNLSRPSNARHLWAPWQPSWGEPYRQVLDRMLAVIHEALDSAETQGGSDIVLVGHQLPLWMVRRALANRSLVHNPKKRELDLSSITTITRQDAGDRGLVEVGYHSPARHMINASQDQGAV